MALYKVIVSRTGYSEIEKVVEAHSHTDAENRALKEASDDEFVDHASEREVTFSAKITGEKS